MKILRFWFPLCFYSVMIFIVSSFPGGAKGVTIPKFDKILHLIEYFPFGFLLGHALCGTIKNIQYKQLLILIVFGSFIYGMSDEIHQYFVPGREMSVFDVIADVLGGSFGGWFYCVISKRRR